MNMKTLLGTAAALMVATGAHAADLPGDAAPAAIDYVKVCDAFGKGFFYIPGTETCLKLSGRVRARTTYSAGDSTDDNLAFRADGRVEFDARTASDIGTVRSFFQTDTDSSNNLTLGDAFVQVGYVTVGKFGNIADGDGLYGVNDHVWWAGDQSGVGGQVMVDKIGGGFYVGASALSLTKNKSNVVWSDSQGTDISVSAAAGVAGQSWGSFDLSGIYFSNDGTVDYDMWGVKATADLKLMDNLKARLGAAYTDGDVKQFVGGDYVDNYFTLQAAVSYAATDAISVYAGVAADLIDHTDDVIYANLGTAYTLAPGLVLNAELNYTDHAAGSDYAGVLQLTRNW